VKSETINERARRAAIKSGVAFSGKPGEKHIYSDEWHTPPHIIDALGPFDLDPCAGPMKFAKHNIGADQDGLTSIWEGRVWLNPPLSQLEDWLAKFIGHGNGVALVPSRTETQWFQRLVSRATSVLFLLGRIRFESPAADRLAKRSSPVGSVLVSIGQQNENCLRESRLPGIMMKWWLVQ